MALNIDAKFEGKLTRSKVWKFGLLLGSFIQSRKYMSLKFTGDLLVMTIKNDVKFEEEYWSVQNWHEEFDKFWPEQLKISKICTLTGCFWPKYIMFELKKYRGVMFDGTEYWCKIWRKTDLCFQKWHEEFCKFSPEHVQKSKNWDFYWVLLSKVESVWAWNLQGSCVSWELRVMKNWKRN